MKDEMRRYFPERFEDEPKTSTERIKKLFLEAADLKRRKYCEATVLKVFERSDELRLLAGAMKKHGCNFDLKRHVSCERCRGCHGGYDPDTNQIVICENKYVTKDRVLSTLMHEMIHMFDYCRAKFDFANLDHVACSEIRAANLTFCSLANRINFPGPDFFKLKGTHQYCVMDVAAQSLRAYAPDVDQSKIAEIVNRVFPGCYNDLEPFGRRPLNGERELKQSYRERYYYGYMY